MTLAHIAGALAAWIVLGAIAAIVLGRLFGPGGDDADGGGAGNLHHDRSGTR